MTTDTAELAAYHRDGAVTAPAEAPLAAVRPVPTGGDFEAGGHNETRGGSGEHRLSLDLHPPTRIEQTGDNDHGCRRSHADEDLAMNGAHGLGVATGGEEHAGAHHVGQPSARLV